MRSKALILPVQELGRYRWIGNEAGRRVTGFRHASLLVQPEIFFWASLNNGARTDARGKENWAGLSTSPVGLFYV